MHSTLALPILLDILSRIVNGNDCTVEILDELPPQDAEVRALYLQIYELRQAMKALSDGELDVTVGACGCIAMYLRSIIEMLRGIERAIKELAKGEGEPELPRLGELSACFELIGRTLQEDRKLISKYRNLSLTDTLTGLPNRRGFQALVEKGFARACRKGRVLSFIMADIDRFKAVNDLHGHEVGDEALRMVARRLLSCLRAEDVCCRYGGEEFLIMLYDTDLSQAVLVAERLRKSVAGKAFIADGRTLHVTVSLGAAEVAMRENSKLSDCRAEILRAVRRSDACLYKAKEAGRNRVVSELSEASGVEGRRPVRRS
ncbi:GGDEF domain-containing protein [uncultured Bilophila sp.]|uniref:GGDEF domain-containing protein n=1 Tax=uncultured Bilophila sp. TaxID=529385 RepID=UPI0026DB48B9|nr:GGDEF domain-containing protein [uncultured Bilophila sp.]